MRAEQNCFPLRKVILCSTYPDPYPYLPLTVHLLSVQPLVMNMYFVSTTVAYRFPSVCLLQFDRMEGIPELGVIVEQAEEELERGDRPSTPGTPGAHMPEFHVSPEPQQHQVPPRTHTQCLIAV